MTHPTLEKIAKVLHLHLERSDTNMRTAIPLLKSVAMTVWWLANVTSFCLVSEQFTVGQSTATEEALEVCLVMEKELLWQTIHLGDVAMVADAAARGHG